MFQLPVTSRAGSSAIDFTQLGDQKCFGTKWKTESELEISVFYLVPEKFCCPNWVKSIADDPAPKDQVDAYAF